MGQADIWGLIEEVSRNTWGNRPEIGRFHYILPQLFMFWPLQPAAQRADAGKTAGA